MGLNSLWVSGFVGVVLGAAGCGGERLDRPLDEGQDTSGGGGETPGADGPDAASVSTGSNPASGTSATGAEPHTPGDDTNEPVDAGASSHSEADVGLSTDDTSDNMAELGRLDVKVVNVGEATCARGSWCWVTPAPFGERFDAVHGSPDGNTVFAVGPDGACVQYDVASGTWTEHRSVERGDLFDVEVVSATEVWVAGPRGLDFFDGTSWERQLVGHTPSVTRTRDGQLWVVNLDKLYTREADEWQEVVPSIDGESVLGERGGVVDVVTGDQDGELWALTFQSHSRPYWELQVAHLKDGTWSQLAGSYEQTYWPAIAAYDGGIYFADGDLWHDVKDGWQAVAALPDQWTSVADSVFQVTGTSFTRAASDEAAVQVPSVSHMWAASAEDVWLTLASGGIMRVNYTTEVTTQPLAGKATLPWHTTSGIEFSASPTDAWRGPELEHFDGTTWTKATTDDGTPYVDAISGTGPDDVWFVGSILVGLWHWDGAAIQTVAPPNPDVGVTEIHAFDAQTLWAADAVDNIASIHRFDGNEWSLVNTWQVDDLKYGKYIFQIAGSSPTNAYVALSDHVAYFDGETWQTVFTAPNYEPLASVATDGEGVWVLGQDYVYQREPNGDWTSQWYGFQSKSWLEVADGAVWMMGGQHSGVLRLQP